MTLPLAVESSWQSDKTTRCGAEGRNLLAIPNSFDAVPCSSYLCHHDAVKMKLNGNFFKNLIRMNLPKILSNWNSIHLLKTIFLAKCFSFSLKPDTKQIFLLLLISSKFSSHSFFSFPLCVSFLVSNYQNDFNCSDCSSSSNNDLQMFYWNDINWGWKKSLKNKPRTRKKCQKFC